MRNAAYTESAQPRRGALRALAALAALALALVAFGCGSSDDGSSDSTSGDSTGVAKAEERVAQASEPMEPNLPKEAVDMSKNQGKTVWYIAPSLQIPYVQEVVAGVEKAADTAGMKVRIFDGKGKVDLFNQGINAAVSQGADGIVIQAIAPETVSGPLAKAKAAGIPVIDLFNRGPDTALPDTITAQVTRDYAENGRLMADFITADSGGDANVLVLTWDIYEIYQEMVPAFEEQLKTLCEGCEIKATESVSPIAPPSELQEKVSTLLRRFPDVDYVVPVSDALALGMVPAVEAAAGEPKIVSSEGDSQSIQIIRDGGVQIADAAGPPVGTIGWAIIDQMGRVLAGQKAAPEDSRLPTQLITAENAEANDKQLYAGFDGFEAEYEELWGLK